MRNEESRRISRYDHLNDRPSSFSFAGQREAQREFLWGLQGVGSTRKAARMTRAAQNSSWLQVEDEENDPDWLADEAVVSWVKVPDTVAVVPDALFVKLKDADPAPPATRSSSSWVSSITISMFYSPSLSWVEQRGQLQGENAPHGKPRNAKIIITRARAQPRN
jgi:hypothetical protein